MYSLNDYQKDAIAFANNFIESDQTAVTVWSLGFAETGEIQELVLNWLVNEVPIDPLTLLKELGDLLWYCALITHQLSVPLQVVKDRTAPTFSGYRMTHYAIALGVAASKVQEPRKKFLGQGHAYNLAAVLDAVSMVIHLVEAIAEHYGYTMSHVCQVNIDKLDTLYPRGFDPAISQARYQ